MSRQLQPSVPLVTLIKTESPTVIKNEPPEEALEKEISPDIKDIDIVYHSLSEDLIKNETVPENILETRYSESVETQVLVKTEHTSDENVTRGTDQKAIEVQGSHEHCNTLSNLETHEQLVLNASNETTSWEKEKEKIKIITARNPVESHEYTSLVEDEHVCNHCQRAYKGLHSLEYHIRKMHREIMYYQCPYCPYMSKWKHNINQHIIPKHKDTKDIRWFQCDVCEMKCKLKYSLTRHMKVHSKHKQMKDGLDLREKRHHCNKCKYRTAKSSDLKRHKLNHLKPKDIPYFHCYHCSYKAKLKGNLKQHIFRQCFKKVKQGERHGCSECDYKTDDHHKLKRHNLVHLKPEEIEYFYCYHCTYKVKWKGDLKRHIFSHHFKNVKQGKRYGCNKCDYETYNRAHLKSHKLTHLKPEEIQYFYCYHCSYKAKQKGNLKKHIIRHFKKEQVKFDCYICNFMTSKRESIIKHIKKHPKV